jgi:hypothetical protein
MDKMLGLIMHELHILTNLLQIKEMLQLNSIMAFVLRMDELSRLIMHELHIFTNLLQIDDFRALLKQRAIRNKLEFEKFTILTLLASDSPGK